MVEKIASQYSKAYQGLSASTWWLALIMLVNRSGTMVVPFMTMYMTQHIGVSIGKAAFVMSLFGIGSMFGALLGGRLTDRAGFFRVQFFTLCAGGILFIILGQIASYSGICIMSFLLSLVNEAFRPANTVAVAHYSKEENRTRSYSLNRLAINLGWALGGALGGLVASCNYSLLFWVDGITNIAAAVLLYLVLRPAVNPVTIQQKPAAQIKTQSVFNDRTYLFFVLLQILFATCFFQLFTILPVFYKTKLHLSESFIGLTMAMNGLLIALVEMVIVYRLEGKRPHLIFIAWGSLLVGLSYAILNVTAGGPVLIATASMLVVTLGEMLSMPFMNSYWIRRTNTGNRGQYAGLFTMSWSLAQVIGPLTGGQIAEKHGYHVLWWATAGVCCLISLLYVMMAYSEKRAA